MKNAGKKDLRWANQLKKLIEKLDKLIFPDAPAKVLIRKASKRNFTATYTHQSRCGGNYYTVFAKNLCSGIREGGNELIFEKRKNGSIKILPPEKFFCPADTDNIGRACLSRGEAPHATPWQDQISYAESA